jgi:hypothetical protein
VGPVLSVKSGHSADYLTGAVAAGRENYYTGAVAAGEPPGRWYGRGAEALGLSGLVDHQDMQALYEHYLDPRDPAFRTPEAWGEAATLGHTGRAYLSEEEIYAAALKADPGASPERRAELRIEAGRRARRNVAFLDATFSVQKSVTVLHTAFEAQEVQARLAAEAAQAAEIAASVAGDTAAVTEHVTEHTRARTAEQSWATYRRAVEDAIWAGNQAGLDYLAEHAGYSRVGHHGGAAGRYVDAHDWTVASFFQHDSRDHDPQLHIHNAILNRVQGPDGEWRTLDSRALHAFRAAAGAVAERTLEEHLTRAIGVRFAARPDGKAREIVGIPQGVMDLFSSRRRAITAKTATMVAAFETRFGRAPNSLELDRLQRQATFATRNAKSHDGETTQARLERWDRELRAEVAGGLGQVAADVLRLRPDPATAEGPVRWSPAGVVAAALAEVQAGRSAWTRSDLTRAISNQLPDQLGISDVGELGRLLNGLTEAGLEAAVRLDVDRPGTETLPGQLRLADGRSAYQAPAGGLYATPAHVHSERLLAAAAGGPAPAIDADTVRQFLATLAGSGIRLGEDQAAAVRGVLTSGAAIETLVGPAGTGKSFVVGALTKAWQDPALWDGTGRKVIGLATSQVATDILAGEGLAARNIARFLATQARLAEGRPSGEDLAWRLHAGDLVVVDESSMVSTADLAAVHQHVAKAGAKLLLTGDHRQLAAVGAGGAMDLLVGTAPSYELVEARRFSAEWERAATLRLREGDPTVLGEYHKQGRLLDAGAVEQAEASAARAYVADTLGAKGSLLIVDTNEQAARLSAQVRAELIRLGQVQEEGSVRLGMQNTWAGVGDLVQARRNGWHLIGVNGNRRAPVNRELYLVTAINADGGLTVAPANTWGAEWSQSLTLPADYVAQDVALGYAVTVHAAEGLTVDTAHAVITPRTSLEALYVALSRARENNTAHVATRTVPADAPTGTVNQAVHRNPGAVLADIFDHADPQRSALAVATEAAEQAGSVRTAAELLVDAVELATAGRTAGWLDQLVTDRHLTLQQRVSLAAEDGGTTLTRILRRAELAGHDPQHILTQAVTCRPLDGARQITNVIHHRIADTVTLDPVGDTYTDWLPRTGDPDWDAYLTHLAAAAEERRAQLGANAAMEAPQWAVEALGPVPANDAERGAWESRAGTVAAHRELTGHHDPATALGAAPKAGQVEAYASWRAAWRALGQPQADRAEREMSDGQLRVRVRAYEREEAWAPRYVANELAGTRQAAQRHRQAAALHAEEARAAADPDQRAAASERAGQAAALADLLQTRVSELEAADQARAVWLVHTAETRAAADRAEAELAERGTREGRDEVLVTAEEWLAAQAEAVRAEDPHRTVTDEADLADVRAEQAADLAAVAATSLPLDPEYVVETDVADIRDLAAAEPPQAAEDDVRVPSAEETAVAVERAHRALVEIDQRQAADERRAADQARAEQLARWHTDDVDRSADMTAGHSDTLDSVPQLGIPTPLDG